MFGNRLENHECIYIYIYIYTHDINASNHSIFAVMDCNTGIRHSKRGNLELSVSLMPDADVSDADIDDEEIICEERLRAEYSSDDECEDDIVCPASQTYGKWTRIEPRESDVVHSQRLPQRKETYFSTPDAFFSQFFTGAIVKHGT